MGFEGRQFARRFKTQAIRRGSDGTLSGRQAAFGSLLYPPPLSTAPRTSEAIERTELHRAISLAFGYSCSWMMVHR